MMEIDINEVPTDPANYAEPRPGFSRLAPFEEVNPAIMPLKKVMNVASKGSRADDMIKTSSSASEIRAVRGGSSLTHLAKHSASYGSPLIARPERRRLAQTDVKGVTRNLLATVREDLRQKDVERAHREVVRRPSDHVNAKPEDSSSNESAAASGDDYHSEDDASESDPALSYHGPKRKKKGVGRTSTLRKNASALLGSTGQRKRKQSVERAEREAEEERILRDERHLEEQSQEAQRAAQRKKAEADAQALAEQRRIAEMRLAEEEARKRYSEEHARFAARLDELLKENAREKAQEMIGVIMEPGLNDFIEDAVTLIQQELEGQGKAMDIVLEKNYPGQHRENANVWPLLRDHAALSRKKAGEIIRRVLDEAKKSADGRPDPLMSARSFKEEGYIFSEAEIFTPGPSEVGGNTPSKPSRACFGDPPPGSPGCPNGGISNANLAPGPNHFHPPISVLKPAHVSQTLSARGRRTRNATRGQGNLGQRNWNEVRSSEDRDNAEGHQGARLASGEPQRPARVIEEKEEKPAEEEASHHVTVRPSQPQPRPSLNASRQLKISQDGPAASNARRHQNEFKPDRAEDVQRSPDAQVPPVNGRVPQFRQSMFGGNVKQHFERLHRRGRKYARLPAYFVGFIAFTLLALLLAHRSSNSVPSSIRWYGFTDVKHNVVQFLPSLLRNPLGLLTGDGFNYLNSRILDLSADVANLENKARLTEGAVKKLDSILPNIINVKRLSNGRIQIADDFWHALKDMIRHDTEIFSLEKHQGQVDISNRHWQALENRLKVSGVPGLDPRVKLLSESDVRKVDDIWWSQSWKTWATKNDKEIRKLLGISANDALLQGKERQLMEQTKQLVDKELAAHGVKNVAVAREDFIKLVSENMEAHRKEIDNELERVKLELQDLVRGTEDALETNARPHGVSREDVRRIADDIVTNAIANAQLSATADVNLANRYAAFRDRINFFSVGNGAVFNHRLSSPTFGAHKSRNWLEKSPLRTTFHREKFAALISWDEAGQCWCAALGAHGERPADVVIFLLSEIIPQEIVVENINPKATVDPRSMPRDVEVWVRIEERESRERALNFMAANFPDTKFSHELVGKKFFQVAAFKYEYDARHDGVLAHKLSDELEAMELYTDEMLVRAVTNYGAPDHTCFYRVRAFGRSRNEGL